MKRILISLGLWFLLVIYCTLDKDNPFDVNSNTYVPPTLTVDWDSTNITQNGTLTIDSLHIRLIGNTPQNEFRHCIDSGNWSGWTNSSIIIKKNIDNGNHTICLATRYPDGKDIYIDSIDFEAAINKDKKKPVITLLTPSDSTMTADSLLGITFKVTDSSGVASVTVNDCTVTSLDSIYIDSVILKDDINTIAIIAVDASPSSNVDTLDATFYYDTSYSDITPPTITLISPQDNYTTAESLLEIRFKVTDAGGISSVTVDGSDVTSSDSIYIDTITLSLDTNKIKIIATDASINKNKDTLTANFIYDPTYIDTLPPSINLLFPADSSISAESSLEVKFVITDVSGIFSVTFNNKNINSTDSIYTDTVELLDSINTVTVIAVDASINRNSDTAFATFFYDSTYNDVTGPTITLVSPGDSSFTKDSTKEVEVNVDDISGVEWVTIDGDTVSPSQGNYKNTVSLTPGYNPIKVVAQDNATSKNRDSLVVMVVYDNVNPSLRLLDPALDSSSIGVSSIRVEAVAKDNFSVKEVTFSVGTTIFSTTQFDDTIYYADVTNLVPNVFTKIDIQATDTVDNSTAISAHVKYDTTDTHTVTFIAGTNGGITGTTTQQVPDGENCSPVTADPDANYHFDGWTGDHTGNENPLTITNVTADMTITANFAIDTHTVTVSAGANGSVVPSGDQKVIYGGILYVTATADPPGFQFKDWTVNGGVAVTDPDETGSFTITDNGTVMANFEAKTYTLTVNAGTGGTASGGGIVTHGVPKTITTTADDLYAFDSWTITAGTGVTFDPNATTSPTDVALSAGDATVQANFNFVGIFDTLGNDHSEGRAIVRDFDGYAIAGQEGVSGYIVKIDKLGNVLDTALYRFERSGTPKNSWFRDMILDAGNNFVCVGYTSEPGGGSADRASYFVNANYSTLAVISEDDFAIGLGGAADTWGPNNYCNGVSMRAGAFISAGRWTTGVGMVTGLTTPSATAFSELASAYGVDSYVISATYYSAFAGQAAGTFATVLNVINSTPDWQYTSAESNSIYFKVRRLSDGSFIAVGYGDDGILLTKITSAGDESWSRDLSSAGDIGRDVRPTSDGGFIIVGEKYVDATNKNDVLLIKTDGSGLNPWIKTYDWNQQDDIGYSVIEATAGDGYIFTGDAGLDGISTRIFLIRTDLNGNVDTSK